MINELIKLANELDSRGLTKEADALDSMLKIASRNLMQSADSSEAMTSQEKMQQHPVGEFASGLKEPAVTALDATQAALDIAGLFPGAGEAVDAVNVAISTARGDAVGATLSLISMIPLAGDAVAKPTKVLLNAAKSGLKQVKYAGTLLTVDRLASYILGKLREKPALADRIYRTLLKVDEYAPANDNDKIFSKTWKNKILSTVTNATKKV